MKKRQLHIISFDVPYPPDYGGVIDVYYKLKALHEQGLEISLHCFEYGRGKRKELEYYCKEVFYYKRKISKYFLLNPLPYIVASRSSEELVKNLLKDESPILFEGLHCCFHLGDTRLKNRRKIVRMHNIEHTYYSNLAFTEKNFFRRKYFENEAKKLERFESVLQHANVVAAISPADTKELSEKYKNTVNSMAFHSHDTIDIKNGKGTFALYHGNLAVGENNKAALYLVNDIFNESDIPFSIAGNGATSELKNAIKEKKNIQLHENISTPEIYSLIQNAQINILPTFQSTGIKLKLLSALYLGRHCLVNSAMVANTRLEPLCLIKDTAEEMKKEVLRCMNIPINAEEEKKKREKILEEYFSTKTNARKLIELLGLTPQ